MLKINFNWIYFLCLFPLSSPPLLRTISTGFILFSYINTKYINHICPALPFLYALPPPTGILPGNDLFYLSVLHLFQVCIDKTKWFCLSLSEMYILCFNQITSRYYLLYLYHNDPLLFNSLDCIALYCLHT